jgi:hypothetical protein
MTKTIFILAVIAIALLAIPASASFQIDPSVYGNESHQVYSDEYYSLGNESWDVAGARVNDFGQYIGIYSELRRQNILLEKQNELIADLTAVLANQSQKTSTMSPMKWKCTYSGPNACYEWEVNPL